MKMNLFLVTALVVVALAICSAKRYSHVFISLTLYCVKRKDRVDTLTLFLGLTLIQISDVVPCSCLKQWRKAYSVHRHNTFEPLLQNPTIILKTYFNEIVLNDWRFVSSIFSVSTVTLILILKGELCLSTLKRNTGFILPWSNQLWHLEIAFQKHIHSWNIEIHCKQYYRIFWAIF